MDSLNLIRHNSFQNQNYRKSTHALALKPLIFKIPLGSFKIQYLCELELLKTVLETNFFNLENKVLRTSGYFNSNF